jgi:hypothetical protein
MPQGRSRFKSDRVEDTAFRASVNPSGWAPQDPDRNSDPARGIALFIVGTGGRSLTGLGHPPGPANLAAGQPAFDDRGAGVSCH